MDALRRHLKRIAKLGGAATLKKHGKDHYRKMSKAGNKKRRKLTAKSK